MFDNEKSITSWSHSIAHSKKITQANVGLVAVVLILALLVFNQEAVVVVVPPTFTEEFTIIGDQVSESYKTSFAMYAANLAGNINPNNSDFIVKNLSLMFPLRYARDYEKQLRAQVEALKIRGVEEQFISLDLIYNNTVDTVWVYGEKRTTSIKSGAETVQKWTFEIRITASNGYPKIMHFEQYPGAPNTRGRMKQLREDRLAERIEDKAQNKVAQ